MNAPTVNAAQFQQMHQGQIPTQHNFPPPQVQQQHSAPKEEYNPAAPQIGMPHGLSNEALGASSLDDLISNASKQADQQATPANTATSKPATPPTAPVTGKEDAAEEKSNKKDKDGKDKAAKPTRLVYSDNEISPEEKMAAMPKYAFTPAQKTIQV